MSQSTSLSASHRRCRTPGLRVQIGLALGLALVTLAALLSFVAGAAGQAAMRRERSLTLTQRAVHLRDLLDRNMFERVGELALLADLADLRDSATPLELQRSVLETLQASHSDYAWIGIAGTDGVVEVDTAGLLTGVNVARRPWFVHGRVGPYVGDVHEALLLQERLAHTEGEALRFVDIALPLLAPDGKPRGVIAAHLSWRWAEELQRTVLAPIDGAGVQLSVVDRQGRVLLGEEPFGTQLLAPEQIAAALTLPAANPALIPGEDEHLTAVVPTQGYRSYPGLGWLVVARQPTAAAFAPVRNLQHQIIVAGTLFGLLFAGLGWLLAGKIVRPLTVIADVAARLRQGERDGLTFPDDHSAAEIRTLGLALRELLASRDARERALEQAMAERIWAEEALRASEARFRLLAEHARDVIFRVCCLPRPALEYVSPSVLALIGYSPEELLADGSLLQAVIHPDDLATLLPLAADPAKAPASLTFRCVHRNGSLLWVELANRLIVGQPDSPLVLQGSARDITARVEAEIQIRESEALVAELAHRAEVEAALRASEERYRIVSEMTSDYVYALRPHPKGGVSNEWVTAAFERVTGYSTAELEAAGGYQLLLVDEDAPITQARAARLFSGEDDVSEFRIRTRSGEIRWIRDYARPIRDEHGAIVQIIGAVRDVTARRLNGRRLAVQHAVTHILAHSSSLAEAGAPVFETIGTLLGWEVVELWLHTPQESTLRLAHVWHNESPSLADFVVSSVPLTFRAGEDLPGHIWSNGKSCWAEDLPHQTTTATRGRSLATAGLRSGVGVPLQHQGLTLGALVCWQREHNRRDPEELAALEVLSNQLAQFIERTRAASVLASLQRLQRAILDSASYTIIATDPNGTITTFNRAAERLLGYRAEELIGKVSPTLFHDPVELADRAVALSAELGYVVTPDFEAFAARLGHNDVDDRVWTYICRDGRRVPVQLVITALEDGGVVRGYLGVGSEISQRLEAEAALRRAKEAAEAADRAKSSFLAAMSHEIRTPLNAIIGLTGLLLDEQLPVAAREHAAIIRNSGDLLLAVINDILDFSKIEADRIELERVPVELQALVGEAVELVGVGAAARPLDLFFHIADDVPQAILGDPIRLRQILVNLLSNAVKFTDAGEVELRVYRDSASGEGERLAFAVRDTGVGIAADQLARLFTPFTQVDSSTTRRHQGTGLGLAICRRLAELMGGAIEVSSALGVGTTFTLRIPVETALAPIRAHSEQAALAGKCVLIIESNPSNRAILAHQVRNWGMHPTPVDSGPTALAMLDVTRFDLALIALHMPEMDGVALAAAIKALPLGRTLPLVLLASGPQVAEEAALFSASITKPVRREQLAETLAAVLGGAKLPSTVPVARNHPAPPLRILVAEDNAVNRLVALRLLDGLGYHADIAHHGGEAVAAVQRQPYDLLLMDLEMPVLDGAAAATAIRALGTAIHQPWIIGLTAHALAGTRERLYAAGMDDYLTKPIRIQELAAAIMRRPADAAPTPAPDVATLVDGAVLQAMGEALGDAGPAVVAEVIELFMDETPALLHRLGEATATGATEVAVALAHTLRGSSGNVGALAMSALCSELEQAGRAGDAAACLALTSRLEALLTPTVAALREQT